MRRLRPEDIEELIRMEGLELKPYFCSAEHKTIGVGHKLTQQELVTGVIVIDGVPVKWSDGLNGDQVSDLMGQDLRKYEFVVLDSVRVPLNNNQFAALVDFCFNVGEFAFRSSTLLKRLNAGQYEAVPGQLRQWVYITQDGKKIVSKGLKNRREAEVRLWSKPDG